MALNRLCPVIPVEALGGGRTRFGREVAEGMPEDKNIAAAGEGSRDSVLSPAIHPGPLLRGGEEARDMNQPAFLLPSGTQLSRSSSQRGQCVSHQALVHLPVNMAEAVPGFPMVPR
jgi:hypothetical protein